jgi:glycogen debranching enzyme
MKDSAQEIIDQAKEVLYGNLKSGVSKWAGEYKYISPSTHHYYHQWFWDSCFVAIVLTHFDIDLAKSEVRSLLRVQRPDGFIPHIVYWGARKHYSLLDKLGSHLESKLSLFPKTTELIQPPLIAEAVEAIYKKEKNIKFLSEVVPKLKSYYLWLAKHRDPNENDLISIVAPYESGMDQSPSYGPVLGMQNKNQTLSALVGRTVTFRNMLRNYNLEKIFEDDYFNVEDVLVNSIYIKNLEVLSRLLHEIDQEDAARTFHRLAEKGKKALIEKCYDRNEEFFFDRYSKEGKIAKVKTVKGLTPIILDLPKSMVEKIVKKHIRNKESFNVPYPVPSVAISEPSFSPTPAKIGNDPLLWRGPTWINMNWYLAKALAQHGYKKDAEKIVESSVALIKKSGYREFFNPLTGEGHGRRNFGWSTLVVDMILS